MAANPPLEKAKKLFRRGKYYNASVLYDEISQTASSASERRRADRNLAVCLLKMEHFVDCFEVLQRFETQAATEKLWYLQAAALHGMWQSEDARIACLKSLQLDPDNEETQRLLENIESRLAETIPDFSCLQNLHLDPEELWEFITRSCENPRVIELAERGHPEAAYCIAKMKLKNSIMASCESGQLVMSERSSHEESVGMAMLMKSCHGGCVPAWSVLGLLRIHDSSLSEDVACKWITRAANAGCPSSKMTLSLAKDQRFSKIFKHIKPDESLSTQLVEGNPFGISRNFNVDTACKDLASLPDKESEWKLECANLLHAHMISLLKQAITCLKGSHSGQPQERLVKQGVLLCQDMAHKLMSWTPEELRLVNDFVDVVADHIKAFQSKPRYHHVCVKAAVQLYRLSHVSAVSLKFPLDEICRECAAKFASISINDGCDDDSFCTTVLTAINTLFVPSIIDLLDVSKVSMLVHSSHHLQVVRVAVELLCRVWGLRPASLPLPNDPLHKRVAQVFHQLLFVDCGRVGASAAFILCSHGPPSLQCLITSAFEEPTSVDVAKIVNLAKMDFNYSLLLATATTKEPRRMAQILRAHASNLQHAKCFVEVHSLMYTDPTLLWSLEELLQVLACILRHFPDDIFQWQQQLSKTLEETAQWLVRELDGDFCTSKTGGALYTNFLFVLSTALRDVRTREGSLMAICRKSIVSTALLRLPDSCKAFCKKSLPQVRQHWLFANAQLCLQAAFVAINLSPAWCSANATQIQALLNHLFDHLGSEFEPLIFDLASALRRHAPSSTPKVEAGSGPSQIMSELLHFLQEKHVRGAEKMASLLLPPGHMATTGGSRILLMTLEQGPIVKAHIEALLDVCEKESSLRKLWNIIIDPSTCFYDPAAMPENTFTGHRACDTQHKCCQCGVAESVRKLSFCAKCRLTKYCSPQCQKRGWKVHKLVCIGREVISAVSEKNPAAVA